MFRILLISIVFPSSVLLVGCHAPQKLTLGSVPCYEDEIEIIEEDASFGSPHTWIAVCKGKRYYCSARYAEKSAPAVNCAAEE